MFVDSKTISIQFILREICPWEGCYLALEDGGGNCAALWEKFSKLHHLDFLWHGDACPCPIWGFCMSMPILRFWPGVSYLHKIAALFFWYESFYLLFWFKLSHSVCFKSLKKFLLLSWLEKVIFHDSSSFMKSLTFRRILFSMLLASLFLLHFLWQICVPSNASLRLMWWFVQARSLTT